ncbi:MAG TPA: hypothetical protein PL110_19420 [Candidatus Eremiobacteraeota bacterium]|nr:MAG: hypothetical protein BWY64_03624 [bacterium ADurb.Bin363]HPZ10269.1 hypothetical protein [Candidatus Eremiobacteraeota bacterium]
MILSEEDKKLMDKMAGVIVSRRLTAIAIFFLESSRPLSFVGSQFLIFMQPFIQSIFNVQDYDRITKLMEDRNNVELFIQTIEDVESKRNKSVKNKRVS